jgi:hypothetical protein
MAEMVLITGVFAVVAYWWDTTRANEAAVRYCRRLCAAEGLQFLDASVSRQKLWLRRSPTGGVELCRLFSFEYSTDAQDRHYGYIMMLGRQIVESALPSRQQHLDDHHSLH